MSYVLNSYLLTYLELTAHFCFNILYNEVLCLVLFGKEI